MYQPDQTDWKIIALLSEDGRISSAEIARRLGDVSAPTVNNRIENLTKCGIINIRSIVNANAIGYDVLADVFIQVEPGTIRDVAEALAELPQISYVACAIGDADIIISIRARSIQDLYNFVVDEIGKITQIRHTEIFPLTHNLKTNESWLPADLLNAEPGKSQSLG